ncbi:MAG TPA: DUF4870 domain-containing protein, partial [bacterium]
MSPNAESQNNVQARNRDENLWAMLCHISAFAGFLMPFGNIIAPLIIWLIKKDEYPLVSDQGKEAINFQITLTIYLFASAILIILVIGIPLLIGLVFFGFIVTVIAAIKASEGERYRYPM